MSKSVKTMIVCLVILLAIVTSGCFGNSQKEIDEARAAQGLIGNAVSTSVANQLDGKVSYSEGATFTIRSTDGNVTFKNGNFYYAIIEYPNGTIANVDFHKQVPLSKEKRKMGYTYDYEYEFEYNINYKNGSTMHFYI